MLIVNALAWLALFLNAGWSPPAEAASGAGADVAEVMVPSDVSVQQDQARFLRRLLDKASPLCLIFGAGLLMRWPPFCTKPGLAALGLVTVGLLHREAIVAYYGINFAVLTFMWIVEWSVPHAQESTARTRWSWSVAAIVGLLVLFVVRSIWANPLGWTAFGVTWPVLLLDMWMLLRLVTVLWEYGAGQISLPTIGEFAAWCGLPFTLSGPLLRFREFKSKPPWMARAGLELPAGWWMAVVTAAAVLVAGMLLTALTEDLYFYGHWGRVVSLYSTAPWSFYLETAGTFALCRQAGILGGVFVPVSFDRPFLSCNISDFWARWNMTATSVFRETLFFNRWGLKVPNIYLNVVVLFLAVGLWHSVNAYWIVWGLLHGVGFSAFIAWKKWRGPAAKASPAWLGWTLTYCFVCTCWAIPPQILKVIDSLVRP